MYYTVREYTWLGRSRRQTIDQYAEARKCRWPLNPWPWKLYQFVAHPWEVFVSALVEVAPIVQELSRNSSDMSVTGWPWPWPLTRWPSQCPQCDVDLVLITVTVISFIQIPHFIQVLLKVKKWIYKKMHRLMQREVHARTTWLLNAPSVYWQWRYKNRIAKSNRFFMLNIYT